MWRTMLKRLSVTVIALDLLLVSVAPGRISTASEPTKSATPVRARRQKPLQAPAVRITPGQVPDYRWPDIPAQFTAGSRIWEPLRTPDSLQAVLTWATEARAEVISVGTDAEGHAWVAALTISTSGAIVYDAWFFRLVDSPGSRWRWRLEYVAPAVARVRDSGLIQAVVPASGPDRLLLIGTAGTPLGAIPIPRKASPARTNSRS